MNIQIQRYYGIEEYAAQADPSNVKISILQDNVTKILDTIVILDRDVNKMSVQYDEERRLLFEALGEHYIIVYVDEFIYEHRVIMMFDHTFYNSLKINFPISTNLFP